MRKSEALFVSGRIILDAVVIFGALIFAYFMRMQWFELFNLSAPTTLFPFELFRVFALKTTAALVGILAVNGRYRFYVDEKFWDEFRNLFWAFSSGMAFLVVIFFFAKFYFFSRFIFGVAWASGLIFILLGRLCLRGIRRIFYLNNIGRSKILVLGTGKIAIDAIDEILRLPRFELIGVLAEKITRKKKFESAKILGRFGDFEKILKKYKPQEVLLAHEHASEKLTPKLVRIAHIYHVNFRFLPDELGLDLAAVKISTFGAFPLVTLLSNKIDGWGAIIKTFFDFLISLLAVVVLSPVFLFISLKIWLQKDGPIFYVSKRVGKNGKNFKCFKFRTMVVDAEKKKKKLLKKNERSGGVLFKIENDPRVTEFGKFLRTWSLDELPQFLNVLQGEMSLIGPRPHLPEEVEKYAKDDRRILAIKPGVTGFSQIHGRATLSFEEEMNFEIFYAKNWTIWLDAVIFFKTIVLIFKKENAH